jgi:hypothetical protein
MQENIFILFIYALFHDAVSNSDHIVLNDRMFNKWIGNDVEGSGHDLIWNTIPASPE